MTYYYRAIVKHQDCGIKRAVAFVDDRRLDWANAEKEVNKNIYSQTCVRCNMNHRNEEYVLIELRCRAEEIFPQKVYKRRTTGAAVMSEEAGDKRYIQT